MANFKTFSRTVGEEIHAATIYDDLMGKNHIQVMKSELRGTDILEDVKASFPTYFRFDVILHMLQRGMVYRG